MYEIESARTLLRIPLTADIGKLAEICGNPEVMKYLDINCQPLSREQTGMVVESIIRGWQKNSFGRWTIINKEDGQIIGLAGFRKHEDIAELFYLLSEDYWGKGLATEIAFVILQAGFERHLFPRIVAMTRPGNIASRRVLDKLGMSFTGNIDVYGIPAVEYVVKKEDFRIL